MSFSDVGWGALVLQGVHVEELTYGALQAGLDHGGKVSLVASRLNSVFAATGLQVALAPDLS